MRARKEGRWRRGDKKYEEEKWSRRKGGLDWPLKVKENYRSKLMKSGKMFR